MAMSTPIKGSALTLTVDGTDYFCDVSSATLENEELDTNVQTFCNADDRQYFFNITAIQSGDPTSFWRFLWDTPADEEVTFIYSPWGNVTASTTQPHFTGSVIVPKEKPVIGGEFSNSRNNRLTFEIRLDVLGTPVTDDGSSS